MKNYFNYINGEYKTSQSLIQIQNPATLETVGLVSDSTFKDVDEAVKSAKNSQMSWWKTPAVEKANLLKKVSDRIKEKTKILAETMTLETGKPLCESYDCIEWVTACFEYYAEIGRSSYGLSLPPVAKHQINFTVKEPYGVVAAIVPFNFPLLLMSWKVAPALMAGNTIVCKAPHQNPITNLLMAQCYDVLPKGVVNVITGGREIGELLVNHNDVDIVAFTGSTEVGRKIASQCGQNLKKVNLELGGIDPTIVFDDADLNVASQAVGWARLLNAGQVCTSAKRIYVSKKIVSTFVQKLTDYVKSVKVGNPFDQTIDVGPVITLEALNKVENQVQRIIKEGAECIVGGKRFSPQGLKGYFFEPTILVNVKHGGVATTEEVFGPVISVIVTENEEESVRLANDSKFGLGACIYTNSLEKSMHAMENIKAGTFWINDPLTDNDAGPFGGMRHSGVGRELGAEGLDAFREPKHVHLDYKMEAKSFWFPYKNREIHHS